ncbi:MAG: hypothetical protein DPW18_13510 [Chloroflexi bacterium]|nr:hypothetical protein [Chloroflexota bacterium]MDL1943401.1 DUF1080 domain-containing protein [Chloroflexi bacterium CFX2]
MKFHHRSLFAFVAFILVVGMACSALGGNEPTAVPTAQPLPTNPPLPTSAPAQPLPTQEQQQPPQPVQNQTFFTEEFDAPLSSSWSILTVTGSNDANPDKVTVEPKNGKLRWDFDSEYVYYYLFYEGASYSDVTIEVSADNLGRNNNSISLICRYDPNVGWYEFNIANNGLYDILYGEVTSSGSIGYSRITNGGSNAIKQGKDVNVYKISCVGDKLSLTINGQDVTTIDEKKFGLGEGGVGVSVSSFNVLPITVEMEYFKISEP